MSAEKNLSTLLRTCELAFSATVAGLVGSFLRGHELRSKLGDQRFVYTEVVAGAGIVISVLFIYPFAYGFSFCLNDLILFSLYMVAMGLIADFVEPTNCGSVWDWGDITTNTTCNKLKASVVFCLLASIFFLASGVLGLWVCHRRRHLGAASPIPSR